MKRHLPFALKSILLVCFAGFLLTACSTTQRPIFLCPPSCKAAVGDWTALRECLFKQDGRYWLTDSAGLPLETYRYKHDHGIFESDVMPMPTSKADPSHISTPILLKRDTKDAVLHLIFAGKEQTFSLGGAKLERHGEYDVFYIQ